MAVVLANGCDDGVESRTTVTMGGRAGGSRFLAIDDDIIVFYARTVGDDAITGGDGRRRRYRARRRADRGRPWPTTPPGGFTPNVDTLISEFIIFFLVIRVM